MGYSERTGVAIEPKLSMQYLYVAFNYIGTNNYEFMVPYLVMALIYIGIVLSLIHIFSDFYII